MEIDVYDKRSKMLLQVLRSDLNLLIGDLPI